MEPKAGALARFEAQLPSAEDLGLREGQQVAVWEKHAKQVGRVLRLGAQKAVGGDAELLTIFSLDLDETEEDKLIEEAVLSGCGDAYDRVMLAVKWGEPKAMLRHLESAAGRLSEQQLSRIFLTALQGGRNDVVQSLIDFGDIIGCNPRSLKFGADFDTLYTVENDRYELYHHLAVQRDREMELLQSRRRESCKTAEAAASALMKPTRHQLQRMATSAALQKEHATAAARMRSSVRRANSIRRMAPPNEDGTDERRGSATDYALWSLPRIIERTGFLKVRPCARTGSRRSVEPLPIYLPNVASDTLE
eukprot:4769967-Prymnesium_polylepis.1